MTIFAAIVLAQTAVAATDAEVAEPSVSVQSVQAEVAEAVPEAVAESAKAPAVPGSVNITSDRSDYDNKEGVIMFDGHVALDALVRGEEYAMRAEQMFVFLDGTNDMKRVVALGSVVVTNGFRVGSCEKAVYAKAANRVTMYGGDDGSKARLASEDPKQKGEVEGRKITFWLDSEQVEVEGSTVRLDAGRLEGDGNKGIKGIFGK